MYGLDVTQFRLQVVRPMLQYLNMHSAGAENLVLGTAMQESRLRYLRQLGGGPAIGLFQMEPATHKDIWGSYIRYRSTLWNKMLGLKLNSEMPGPPLADEMAGNLYYAAAMCRVHYYRKAAAVPAEHDALGLATYWKIHYNTPDGAGTVEEALPHFQAACE